MSRLATLRLHRRVEALLQPWQGARPGMTVGIVQDGTLTHHQSAGLASIEFAAPITPATTFRIASVSKQFTCAAILLLVAEGRLDLSQPVTTYLPDLPDIGHHVTVDQLMHNSSGLRDMLEIMRQGGIGLGDHLETEDLLAGIHRQRTLNFTPGTRFLYSNTNFLLLGRIVEALEAEPLAATLARRIFTPLGMTSTRHTPNPRTPEPGLATGYLPRAGASPQGSWLRASHGFPLGGEGGLVSCVEDLALWDQNFVTGLVGGSALVDGMQHQHTFPSGTPNLYLRGLRADTYRGTSTVSHGGLWPGYRTEFLRAPDLDATIIAITNDGGSDPAALAHQVLDVLLEGRPGIHPIPPLPSRPTLEALTGRWISAAGTTTIDIALTKDGTPTATQNGALVRLAEAADGRLTVTHGTILLAIHQPAADTIEVEADAGQTTQYHRAPAAPTLPPDLDGRYTSPEMASIWTIAGTTVTVDGPLRINTTWTLDPIAPDLVRIHVPGILQPAWFDACLLRTAEGTPTTLSVNTARLRTVLYTRQ